MSRICETTHNAPVVRRTDGMKEENEKRRKSQNERKVTKTESAKITVRKQTRLFSCNTERF